MQLVKQNLGAHWVIGIKGNKDEIEQFHNRIYNWGGTNGELQWMSESFAYFWITLEKLERVMFKYVMNSMSVNRNSVFHFFSFSFCYSFLYASVHCFLCIIHLVLFSV